MTDRVRTIICGGSGYVAGELLRLLAYHPVFDVDAVYSGSHAGEPVESAFRNLGGTYGGLTFSAREDLAASFVEGDPVAVFSAAPHGESAKQIDSMLDLAEAANAEVRLVDLSADFRYRDVGVYEQLYGPHGAPERVGQFHCSLPEHGPQRLRRHVAHPGCFTTSVLLPTVALAKLELIEPTVRVSSVTGSSGSGKNPKPGTHHPVRDENLWAYNPLRHRHEPEMGRLTYEATGTEVDVRFVPHSGPYVRGIHTTIHADLAARTTAEAAAAAISEFYADCPFVSVVPNPPRLKDVVGTNHCHLFVAVSGQAIVVLSVIDNMVKGAAGGAIQWMNRLFGLEDAVGLIQPGLG